MDLFGCSYILQGQATWLPDGYPGIPRRFPPGPDNYLAVRPPPELFFTSPDRILQIPTIRLEQAVRLSPGPFDWSNKHESLNNLAYCVQMAITVLSGLPQSASPLELPTLVLERLREFARTILGGCCQDGDAYRKLNADDLCPLTDWLTDEFTEDLLTRARVSAPTDELDQAANMRSLDLRFSSHLSRPLPLYEEIKTATDGRIFYVTEKGSMGLGPASTQIGDTVHIFPGGSTHFMLRKMAIPMHPANSSISRLNPLAFKAIERLRKYELVGDCYLNTRYPARTPGFGGQNLANDDEPALEGSLPFELLFGNFIRTTVMKGVETIMLA